MFIFRTKIFKQIFNTKQCQFLQTDEVKKTILNGFMAAEITDAMRKTRLNSVVDSLNPYL